MLPSAQHKKADAATKPPYPTANGPPPPRTIRTAPRTLSRTRRNQPAAPKKWTSQITHSPHPQGPSRPVRKLQSNPIPLHEGINLICEGRDAQNEPLFLPRRNQPPAPDHIRPPRHPLPTRGDQPRATSPTQLRQPPSPQTQGSTAGIRRTRRHAGRILANAGINPSNL